MRAYDQLHEIALDQHGLVTTDQARHHNVDPRAVIMMARRGKLRRLTNGVYLDTGAPTTKWTPYLAAALWPKRSRAVLSHTTALSLMDISDVNPALIHVTVPNPYRTHRTVPKTIRLHHSDLREDEVTYIEGLPVTTAARSIRDCATKGIGPAFLAQALDDARRDGWLRDTEANALEGELRAGGYL